MALCYADSGIRQACGGFFFFFSPSEAIIFSILQHILISILCAKVLITELADTTRISPNLLFIVMDAASLVVFAQRSIWLM